MGRTALSQAKKDDIDSKFRHHWIEIAANRYKEGRDSGRAVWKSARDVCTEVMQECFEKTGKRVNLVHGTITNRANGMRSAREVGEEKRWLSVGEEEQVIAFAIDTAKRGFPLNHRRLKEHVDMICRARNARGFPEGGVGVSWTSRFLTRHSDRLRPYWSHSLDNSRARAVNPTNVSEYFRLLEEVIKGGPDEEEIPAELIYGMDETGIQLGVGQTQRVFGPTGQSVQYQQRSGDRENVTVVVTVCADGTSLSPAVIFKGESYQTGWKQDNPLNASIGHSPNGYVTGEIGIEWIKKFDNLTKRKANGRRRLLLVDGHSSHYTRQFLEYARANRIHVLCYPSHSTHALQGLDVVIFGPLKQAWTTVRDNYERQGGTVSKRNFLSLYAKAHNIALTSDNIKAAFRKTGVVPLNPAVIPNNMMAPSLESSSHGVLPLLQTSPVRALTTLICEEVQQNAMARSGEGSSQPTRSPPRTPTRPRRTITSVLHSTSLAYLTSPTPIPVHAARPVYHPYPVTPSKRRWEGALKHTPRTEFEADVLGMLADAQAQVDALKEQMITMQAAVVLDGVFVTRAQERMQKQDEKGGMKKSKKIMGDGLPKLLDGDLFYNLVVDHDAAQDRKEAEKVERRAEKQRYDEAMKVWNQQVEYRKGRVLAQAEWYKQAVAEWEIERDRAKAEHRRAGWEKPKKGSIEPMPPKPKLRRRKQAEAVVANEDEDEDEDQDEDQEDPFR
ncbi:centromere protein B [Ganoderma sinense ZZ0214-1]|uniref:Centromere protein B n=1 Tax=Ganoderma sinense ZZ0214-1 TaxID=1077348 RepID=A0A2G8RYI6_9APHY|nr:centromere protein B [Ganoderma sinense ZZ0214-1]